MKSPKIASLNSHIQIHTIDNDVIKAYKFSEVARCFCLLDVRAEKTNLKKRKVIFVRLKSCIICVRKSLATMSRHTHEIYFAFARNFI